MLSPKCSVLACTKVDILVQVSDVTKQIKLQCSVLLLFIRGLCTKTKTQFRPLNIDLNLCCTPFIPDFLCLLAVVVFTRREGVECENFLCSLP